MAHLWEVKHAYACSDGNYHSNDWTFRFSSWSEFVDDWGAADEDYNLVFRWDWQVDVDDNDDPTEAGRRGDGTLQICYILQRKGCYATCFDGVREFSVRLVKVTRDDEKDVREWLLQKHRHLLSLWLPLE